MQNVTLLHSIFSEEARVLAKEKVETFPKNTPLRKIVDTMAGKNIGCVVIEEYGRPIGIFTERDLLRKVMTKGINLDLEPVEKHMTSNPVSVGMEAPVMTLLTKMRAGNFRHMLLTDDEGILTGVASVRDVLNYLVDAIARSKA